MEKFSLKTIKRHVHTDAAGNIIPVINSNMIPPGHPIPMQVQTPHGNPPQVSQVQNQNVALHQNVTMQMQNQQVVPNQQMQQQMQIQHQQLQIQQQQQLQANQLQQQPNGQQQLRKSIKKMKRTTTCKREKQQLQKFEDATERLKG